MTFTDAAAEVLRLVGRPLHYKEITDIAIEKNLLSHVGKSPEVTMGARLAATLKKDDSENPLVRVKPGVFALREWDEKTIKSGLEKKGKKSKADKAADVDGAAAEGETAGLIGDDEIEVDVDDEETAKPPTVVATPRAPAYVRLDDEERGDAAPDDVMRAEAAAGAAEIFDEEDDDDQPIFGGPDDRPAQGQAGAGEQADGRRRRRRRRRGRGNGSETAASPSGSGLPTYQATPAFEGRREDNRRDDSRRDDSRREGGSRSDSEAAFRPQVIDLSAGDGTALDDLAGRDLADAIAAILSTLDRNAGPVSLRQIAETAQRRGRLAGDAQLAQSQIAAAVRSDNHRRLAAGQRPRFRFAGGRVALTDWLLGGELGRLEQDALVAVERYRDAARRAFARKIGELPGHAFVELCVLALERTGVGQLRGIRRAGAPGGETHFSGVLRTAGEEVRAAFVIRRDGREIGRERVTELRGSLHHYNQATVGWILTAGQVLSGAREEAAIAGTPPIALFDGLGVAKLCEDNDVAVLRARLPIAIPDVDLLEALRAS